MKVIRRIGRTSFRKLPSPGSICGVDHTHHIIKPWVLAHHLQWCPIKLIFGVWVCTAPEETGRSRDAAMYNCACQRCQIKIATHIDGGHEGHQCTEEGHIVVIGHHMQGRVLIGPLSLRTSQHRIAEVSVDTEPGKQFAEYRIDDFHRAADTEHRKWCAIHSFQASKGEVCHTKHHAQVVDALAGTQTKWLYQRRRDATCVSVCAAPGSAAPARTPHCPRPDPHSESGCRTPRSCCSTPRSRYRAPGRSPRTAASYSAISAAPPIGGRSRRSPRRL